MPSPDDAPLRAGPGCPGAAAPRRPLACVAWRVVLPAALVSASVSGVLLPSANAALGQGLGGAWVDAAQLAGAALAALWTARRGSALDAGVAAGTALLGAGALATALALLG